MLLEVVCCTPTDCEIAEANGADRIELCTALEVGGVTPSRGLVKAARLATSLPIVAMLRVRGGSFVYTKAELDAMAQDLEDLLEADVQGIVFGALQADRSVDIAACERIVENAKGRPLVFHRAFDHAADLEDAYRSITDLGFHRVLTSGDAPSALEGIETLKNLQSRGAIEVLPGGGVRLDNVATVLRETGCQQVHMAPRVDTEGGPVLDGEHVRQVAMLLENWD